MTWREHLDHVHPLLLASGVMALFFMVTMADAARSKDTGRFAGPVIFGGLACGFYYASFRIPNPF